MIVENQHVVETEYRISRGSGGDDGDSVALVINNPSNRGEGLVEAFATVAMVPREGPPPRDANQRRDNTSRDTAIQRRLNEYQARRGPDVQTYQLPTLLRYYKDLDSKSVFQAGN